MFELEVCMGQEESPECRGMIKGFEIYGQGVIEIRNWIEGNGRETTLMSVTIELFVFACSYRL